MMMVSYKRQEYVWDNRRVLYDLPKTTRQQQMKLPPYGLGKIHLLLFAVGRNSSAAAENYSQQSINMAGTGYDRKD